MSKYNYPDILKQREANVPWKEIAAQYGVKEVTIRRTFNKWNVKYGPFESEPTSPKEGAFRREEPDEMVRLLTREDISRISTLEDLLDFFRVDIDRWQVDHFRVNMWETYSDKKGVTPLYQVRATLGRNMERSAEIAAETYAQALADLRDGPTRSLSLPPFRLTPLLAKGEPCILEVAAFDPHIGMYAWAQEVGQDYDSSLAVRAYKEVVGQILSMSTHYPIDRILYVVGNDLSHVDAAGEQQKGGQTTAGTQQDFDSRLPKMFSAVRRAVVSGIDLAREIAPVDVLIVPGNHDEQTSYKVGEVLAAWYRNDPAVNVYYDPDSEDEAFWPRRRQFYQYGENGFMFTHGMEYKRKRDPLPLLFATESPAAMWASTTYREVHTGHNHIRMTGRYQPEIDVTETRAIITRSLPGLTATDSWHYNQGYRHQRAGTALIYREGGGIAGLHEFTPST